MPLNSIFADIDAVKNICGAISREIDPSLRYRIMEVCGTHTMSIAKYGIRSLLPENIELVSGPGCPVCVTSQSDIDSCIELAYGHDVVITTFGDMLKVKGSEGCSLYNAKADKNNVRVVYSPLDTFALAKDNPEKRYVFLAVGFETTTPMAAALVKVSADAGLKNISVFSMCKTMPAAFNLLLSDPYSRIDGFLCPGNVSIITGSAMYEPIASAGKPAVIAGFEPVDILSGVLEIVRQINKKQFSVVNNYIRAAANSGNKKALALTHSIFTPSDAVWRGLGMLKNSGMAIKKEFSLYNAINIYNIDMNAPEHSTPCRCGDILKGHITPTNCPLFGKACTPINPIGPCMVSSEGSCAAYYKYSGI